MHHRRLRPPAPPAVVAPLHDPAALLAAADAGGVDNLQDFVFIASLVSGWGVEAAWHGQ